MQPSARVALQRIRDRILQIPATLSADELNQRLRAEQCAVVRVVQQLQPTLLADWRAPVDEADEIWAWQRLLDCMENADPSLPRVRQVARDTIDLGDGRRLHLTTLEGASVWQSISVTFVEALVACLPLPLPPISAGDLELATFLRDLGKRPRRLTGRTLRRFDEVLARFSRLNPLNRGVPFRHTVQPMRPGAFFPEPFTQILPDRSALTTFPDGSTRRVFADGATEEASPICRPVDIGGGVVEYRAGPSPLVDLFSLSPFNLEPGAVVHISRARRDEELTDDEDELCGAIADLQEIRLRVQKQIRFEQADCDALNAAASVVESIGGVRTAAVAAVVEKGADPLDDDDRRDAAWFNRATDGALYADILKGARQDGRLCCAERRGKRWYYSQAEVVKLWPQYRAMIERQAVRDGIKRNQSE